MKPNESPLDPTERILAAFQSMMQRQMPHHASELNTIDVTMAQAKALYALVAAGELRMSDLAARLGVTSSTATGVVDRLVELSLAVRHDDPHDRRQVVISATPRAQAELERFRELNAAQMRHLLSFVDPADLPIIERAIELMSVAADAAGSQPPPVTPGPKKGDRP
jgi:DNA-binding MarR family transcriptional regulator